MYFRAEKNIVVTRDIMMWQCTLGFKQNFYKSVSLFICPSVRPPVYIIYGTCKTHVFKLLTQNVYMSCENFFSCCSFLIFYYSFGLKYNTSLCLIFFFTFYFRWQKFCNFVNFFSYFSLSCSNSWKKSILFFVLRYHCSAVLSVTNRDTI